MSQKTKTLVGPNGIRIELDKDQVFKDDPGQGTPAMVRLNRGRHKPEGCSTYTCASNEGEIDAGSDGFVKLNEAQCLWLNQQEDAIGKFLGW